MYFKSFFILSSVLLWSCSSSPQLAFEDTSTLDGERLASRRPASATSTVDNKLKDFYRSKSRLKLDAWQSIALDEAYLMPAGKPVDAFYNTHLIRAQDDKGSQHFFRPVDTTTGCQSGCTPVVFHLHLDAQGKLLAIYEEDIYPLRKIYHQKFTDEDKNKIFERAKKVTELSELLYIAEPKQITDSQAHFPPQTWSIYKSLFVEGGAYTSFRILEATLKSSEAIRGNHSQPRGVLEQVGEVKTRVENVSNNSDLRKFLQKAQEVLSQKNIDPRVQREWIAGSFYFFNILQNRNDVDLSGYKNFFRNSVVKKYFQAPFCELLTQSVNSAQTSAFVLEVAGDPALYPKCDDQLMNVLSLLAANLSEDSAALAGARSRLDFKRLAPFVSRNAQHLRVYAEQAKEAGFYNEYLSYMAQLKARYPRLDLEDLPELAKIQSLEAEQRKKYIEELTRSFLDPPRSLKPVKDLKGASFPASDKHAKLYVFVASWCPHCKHKVESWVQADYSKEFWDRIQLVEVFPRRGGTSFDDFCKETGLLDSPQKQKCADAFRLGRIPEHDQLMSSLEIFGVPAMAIFDKKGRLVSQKFELSSSDDADIQRDLLEVLEWVDAR